MTKIAVTMDGRHVFRDLFKLYDRYGLPLEVLFDMCRESNFQPGFYHFIVDALNAGWNPRSIIARLREAIGDVYGRAYWAEVEPLCMKTLAKVLL